MATAKNSHSSSPPQTPSDSPQGGEAQESQEAKESREPQDSQEQWYRDGLRFSCTQCGNCCKNHGDYTYVYLASVDVLRIAEHLGLKPADFVRDYCKTEDDWITLRMDAPACPFLEPDNRCGIYPVRPKQCATWPFWEENLKQATWEGSVKACCPGIDSGPLTSAEEVERIARETEEWYEE